MLVRRSWVVAALSLGVLSCGGGGLNLTSTTCPSGRTLLDGVCVSEAIADYVACVRAQGAQLGGARTEQISAEAGAFGVKAGGSAELKESLEKKYAASDAAMLEIVKRCGTVGIDVPDAPPTTATGAAAPGGPAASGPATPSCGPKDLPECTKECEAGKASGCEQLEAMCRDSDALACNNVGIYLATGEHMAKNEPRALALFDRACTLGQVLGCNNLVFFYREQNGAAIDRARVVKRAREVCASGGAYACDRLKELGEKP